MYFYRGGARKRGEYRVVDAIAAKVSIVDIVVIGLDSNSLQRYLFRPPPSDLRCANLYNLYWFAVAKKIRKKKT